MAPGDLRLAGIFVSVVAIFVFGLSLFSPTLHHLVPAYRAVLPREKQQPVLPRKVFRFLKDAGYGLGNMQTPLFWDDVDERRALLIVDVGACDGSDWSVPAVKKRGHTVIAFEPMPENVDRFMQTVRANGLEGQTVVLKKPMDVWPTDSGRIFLFVAGVSNFTGTVHMHSQGELASVFAQDFYRDGGQNTLAVNVVSLDTIIRNQTIHLLKIDTQGNEFGVLLGARSLFEANRIYMVQLEFWPRGMAAGGVSAVDVLDFLHGFRFMCFDYSRNRHIPAHRPGDFEGFVASFDNNRDDGFGGWDELVCFNTVF